MFESLFLIFVGLNLGWFVFSPPTIMTALKDSICREFPKVKPFLRKDVG